MDPYCPNTTEYEKGVYVLESVLCSAQIDLERTPLYLSVSEELLNKIDRLTSSMAHVGRQLFWTS